MSEEPEQQSFQCEALPDGRVQLSLSQSGEQLGSISVPAEKIADVVVALLSASTAAGKLAGTSQAAKPGESMFDVPTAIPTSIGLMKGQLLNTSAVMLQFGPARVAIRLADKEMEQLGQAMGTMVASRNFAQ
jgi:hypothetical protein